MIFGTCLLDCGHCLVKALGVQVVIHSAAIHQVDRGDGCWRCRYVLYEGVIEGHGGLAALIVTSDVVRLARRRGSADLEFYTALDQNPGGRLKHRGKSSLRSLSDDPAEHNLTFVIDHLQGSR